MFLQRSCSGNHYTGVNLGDCVGIVMSLWTSKKKLKVVLLHHGDSMLLEGLRVERGLICEAIERIT